ncbi:hypothetical protein BC936DRAFT_137678 [Jimgerdemannia flammicorona]|uniref:Cytochrome P450 n=1 Tax=Jimgerdemannia flammicorona TaxID=994334 RepID=A0A433CWV7_9FUNG|nr:hypothetical protein BC936DRAFT_137678 [Jimgerdemannia flammicorona]
MCSVIFNKSFTMDDPDFKEIVRLGVSTLNVVGDFTLELFPFLAPFLRSKIRRAGLLQLQIKQVFGKYVEEVRQARKDGNEVKCACNEYLKAQETDNENGHMDDVASKFGCYYRKGMVHDLGE